MSSKRVVIDLFYDVVSPYSWISFEALTRYQKVWPIELRLRPFFLGAVMKISGNRPPLLTCPPKGMYMFKDIEKNNAYWGTKLVPPENFGELITTKNTIQAQRMLAAIQVSEPEKLESVSREFWTRFWTRGESIYEREDFEKVASTVGLKNPTKVFELMNSPEVKKIIADNVDEAIELGAFGAPWIVVTHLDGNKESFFGSDRMHFIADAIGQPFMGPLKEKAKL